jgi:hypothetical protein
MHAKVTDFRSHQVVLRVDFDLLDDNGRMRVSMRFQKGRAAPERGDLVYLLDGQGRGCVGQVEAVDGWYVRVRPDWNTWVGGPRPSGLSGA